MNKMIRNLRFVMEPTSIAIVGASVTPNKIGNVLVRNFVDGRYKGKIYPVNPKYKEVLGLKCYSTLSAVPGKIDCVVVATPAKTVSSIMKECVKKKVGGVIVITSGFEEIGRHDLAKEIRELAEKNDIPVIGPNCLGIFNPSTKMDTIFLPMYKLERPDAGNIAFVTQSGAVGSTVTDLAAHYGVGVSKFVSYGNATVIDESDVLEYLTEDDETEIIVLYMEGVNDGRRFYETIKKANKKKPVLVLKGGKGKGGQAAARSHTGNIAGSYLAYQAAFKQAKVTEAEGLHELFEFVKIFNQPKPKGNRVGIVTNGGGVGILTTDGVEKETNLMLAEFSETTKKKIASFMPSYGNIGNPLDLVADSGVDAYDKALGILMDAPEVDILVIVTLLQTPPMDERIIHVLTKASADRRKPIATISIGGTYTEAYRKILESNGVPNYDSPLGAIKAISKLVTYANYYKYLKRG